MAEELVIAAEKAAKDAKKAMVLTVIAVVVAIAVLAIDNGIKRSIVEEAKKAQALFDAIKEAAHGAPPAGEAGNPAGPGLNGSHVLVHDSPAGTDVDKAAAAPEPPPVERKARPARRASGDG